MTSKLGPHVIESTPAGLSWSRQASIVKDVDNLEPLLAAPDSAVRIWRHAVPNEQDTSAPITTAQGIVASLNGYHHRNLYVEVWNEAHPTTVQLFDAVNALHDAGYLVAGGSWGTGDYTQVDWDIARASGCDIITCHSYWDPGKLDQWEAYRYRQFWEAGDPPVAITECGRRLGYHDLNELLAYGVEIGKDSYVLGALPFTCGPWYYPGVDPQAFNVDSLVPQLMAAQPPQPTPPSPGGNVITDAELQRLVSNAYTRANVPYNPTSAFCRFFESELKAGRYLGAPEEPEHLSEDGSLVLQRFANAYAWCRKDYVVQTGPLPFG